MRDGHSDLVYYAGRETFLPTFLKLLHARPCHSQPITLITGSDAAALRDTPELYNPRAPILGDPNAPINVVYTPLADQDQLDNPANPDRSLYLTFKTNFTSHFHARDLATGWAIVAHDAMTTAITAIRQATKHGGTPHPVLPNKYGVRNQLAVFVSGNVVSGASGTFGINPQTGDRVNAHPLQPVTLPTR